MTFADLLALKRPGDRAAALESFVANALFDGGAWTSPRESDGVARFRVAEEDAAHLRVAGWIWLIDQSERPFWLDVAWGHLITWTLFFDVAGEAPRARKAIDAASAPQGIDWRVVLTGDARLPADAV